MTGFFGNTDPMAAFRTAYEDVRQSRGREQLQALAGNRFAPIAAKKARNPFSAALGAIASPEYQKSLKMKSAQEEVAKRAKAAGINPNDDRAEYLKIAEEVLRDSGLGEEAETARAKRTSEEAAAAKEEREEKLLTLKEEGLDLEEETLDFKKDKFEDELSLEKDKLKQREKEEQGKTNRHAKSIAAAGKTGVQSIIDEIDNPENSPQKQKNLSRALDAYLTAKTSKGSELTATDVKAIGAFAKSTIKDRIASEKGVFGEKYSKRYETGPFGFFGADNNEKIERDAEAVSALASDLIKNDPNTTVQAAVDKALDFIVGGSKPAASSTHGFPPAAVEILKKDLSPEAMKEFDETFGPGAAQKVMGGS